MPEIHPIIDKVENPPNPEPILDELSQNELIDDVFFLTMKT